LWVKYSNIQIDINVSQAETLGDVYDAIKAKFADSLPAPAALIQLRYQDGPLVEDLEDIPDEYFLRPKLQGAKVLQIVLNSIIDLPRSVKGIAQVWSNDSMVQNVYL
jgi:hypothetical protein